MLKPEFIKKLKQTNVSENSEKTMERLRAVWMPLAAPERGEILALVGLKRTSIERAYKTGSVSAKILAGFAQVLNLDPYYLAGKSDEKSPFDDALLIQFLKDLNYDVSKGAVARRKKAIPESAELPVDVIDAEEAEGAEEAETPVLLAAPDKIDLSAVASDIIKLDSDSQQKLEKLSEENLILMLKSLTIQAGFSEDKKKRLALIKNLLLV